jgi:hypothetical protein
VVAKFAWPAQGPRAKATTARTGCRTGRTPTPTDRNGTSTNGAVVDLSLYIRNLERESFAPGATIVTRGDVGDAMYVIVEG